MPSPCFTPKSRPPRISFLQIPNNLRSLFLGTCHLTYSLFWIGLYPHFAQIDCLFLGEQLLLTAFVISSLAGNAETTPRCIDTLSFLRETPPQRCGNLCAFVFFILCALGGLT